MFGQGNVADQNTSTIEVNSYTVPRKNGAVADSTIDAEIIICNEENQHIDSPKVALNEPMEATDRGANTVSSRTEELNSINTTTVEIESSATTTNATAEHHRDVHEISNKELHSEIISFKLLAQDL